MLAPSGEGVLFFSLFFLQKGTRSQEPPKPTAPKPQNLSPQELTQRADVLLARVQARFLLGNHLDLALLTRIAAQEVLGPVG